MYVFYKFLIVYLHFFHTDYILLSQTFAEFEFQAGNCKVLQTSDTAICKEILHVSFMG